ncbi:DUF2752 domain-containing protein [Streptomyces litchfieldiae]|uniref:DUF2752 domain-containing protein n=1 Tax=Streptomyces litchfieldiae TaxID=3075543 RepID=A0ABU2N1T8_9ACTN|nr:DUF2752 domain-containing protein [Streptomyces sp. DSM 44938]MDT0347716.1 DUF2752 domain-containing protein [Streptomyces sp. DSM 44938]
MPLSRPRPAARAAAAPLAAFAAAGAAFCFVAVVDPNEPGHYPACPVLSLTGLSCPGCGGLRSAHALAHGDLAGALDANALAVAGFAALAGVLVLWLTRALRGRPAGLAPRPAHGWALGALALAFTLLRNVPLGATLAP